MSRLLLPPDGDNASVGRIPIQMSGLGVSVQLIVVVDREP